MYDYHGERMAELEKDIAGRTIDVTVRRTQAQACRELANLIGRVVHAMIKKSMDAGELKDTWWKALKDSGDDANLALAKILNENTLTCVAKLRDQADLEKLMFHELNGQVTQLKQELEKAKARRESVYIGAVRRGRDAGRDADGRPIPVKELVQE